MPRANHSLLIAAVAILALPACEKKATETAPTKPPEPAVAADESAPLDVPPPVSTSTWTETRADFVNTLGQPVGTVEFKDGLGGVLIRIDMRFLTPGWHGIHLHQVGDCSDGADGFKLSGGHINPDNKEHGLLNPNGSHRADLPNLYADKNGDAKAEFFRAGLHLMPSEEAAAVNGPFPLLDDDGFAVIVHEDADDQMTQPIGGAGARVACAALK